MTLTPTILKWVNVLGFYLPLTYTTAPCSAAEQCSNPISYSLDRVDEISYDRQGIRIDVLEPHEKCDGLSTTEPIIQMKNISIV